MAIRNKYYEGLLELQKAGLIELTDIPNHFRHNGHLFYIASHSETEKDDSIRHLKSRHVTAAVHHIPFYSSRSGKRFSAMLGENIYTTADSR